MINNYVLRHAARNSFLIAGALSFGKPIFSQSISASASSTSATVRGSRPAYPADMPIAERPSTLPKGFFALGMIAGSDFSTGNAPQNFTLMASYPLTNRLQLGGSLYNANGEDHLYRQSSDVTALYQLWNRSPWGSMVSASWMQGIYPHQQRDTAAALSGTVSYQFKRDAWYLFVTQLGRYHFTTAEQNAQLSTSLLGGRQMTSKLWLNVGWTLLDFSSNARATRTLLDPQPFYLNGVWAMTESTDLTGSIGTTSMPINRSKLALSLGINVRTPV